MSSMIKIRIDKDNELPFETTVNATDRISIIIDDMGISVRSDGEVLESANKTSGTEMKLIQDFGGQMKLFDSQPWKMDI